ncbi:MAG: hypothetical protein MJE77_38805 [Proteobacteria bacterium]|nr:hypothetical protein [Pseudomonadota bacterium]
MAISRRSFIRGTGLAALGCALSPLVRVRPTFGGDGFDTRKLVIVAIGGGLRNREALGMAEGATMPNLFGDVPLIAGFGSQPAGPARVAPEFAANVPRLVLPPVRPSPLYTEGALITNLRYAEGAPGHLQGQGCVVSGFYNNLENRADARLPVPTIFEILRRERNAPATDAWYISVVGGFYRALQQSAHAEFGVRYGGSFLSPPGVLTPIVPIATSGVRAVDIAAPLNLPAVANDPAADAAAKRLTGIVDGNFPAYSAEDGQFRATPGENDQVQQHLAEIYRDNTYQSFFPDSFGIGVASNDGIDGTADAITTYHAERILHRFKPTVTAITLLDIDAAHSQFNGYIRGQQIADACVNHLWNFIQSTDGLRDQTTMIVLPEHGRHLFHNGNNPDSLGRSGVDHGQGDDGDRDIWMLALGPDIRPNTLIEKTGIDQAGRTSGRYETIDAVMTAMTLLGHGEVMKKTIEDQGVRPGLVIQEIVR